jgi:hypothetical protein
VGRDFSLSGLLLVDMNAELIHLGDEASLAVENSWKRSEPPKPEPVKDVDITTRQRSLRQPWEILRSHDYSALND